MTRLGLQLLVLLAFGLCFARISPDTDVSRVSSLAAVASWVGLAWLAAVSWPPAGAPRDAGDSGDSRSAYFAAGLLALSTLPVRALAGDLRLVAAFAGTWALWRGAASETGSGAATWIRAGSVCAAGTWAACVEPRWLPLSVVAIAWALWPAGQPRSDQRDRSLLRRLPERQAMGGLVLGAGLALLLWFGAARTSWPMVETRAERAEAWRPLTLERVASEARTLVAGQRTGLLATAPFFLAGWFGLRHRTGLRASWPVLGGLGIAMGAELVGGTAIERGGLLSLAPALLVVRPRPPRAILAAAVLAFAVLGAGLIWHGAPSPLARGLLLLETDRIEGFGTHTLLESPQSVERWFWAPTQDLSPRSSPGLSAGSARVAATAHWIAPGADGDWLVLSTRSLTHLDVLISGPQRAIVDLVSAGERVSVVLDSEEKRRGTPVRLALGDALDKNRLPVTPAGVAWGYRMRVRASETVLLDFVE